MKLSVASLNVFYKAPAEGILQTIEKLKTTADVLCIQELTETSRYNPEFNFPEKIIEIGYKNAYYLPTLRKNGTVMGNGIFSKPAFPFLTRDFVDVQDEDPQSKEAYIENRKYLEVTISPTDGCLPLKIGTVQLSPPNRAELDFTDEKKKEDKRIYEAVCRNTGRYILTADLNAVPDYPLVPSLLRLFANAGPDLALDSWKYISVDETNAYDNGKLPQRLDYSLVTPDLNVIASDFFSVYGSDHQGILTVLDI